LFSLGDFFFCHGGVEMNKDKKMHFLSGFSITILVGLFLHIFLHWRYGYLIGFSTAIIFGATKEYIFDYKMKKGTPEWMDFFATVLGGLLGYFIVLNL